MLVPTVALSSLLDQRIVYKVDPEGKVSVTPVETGGTHGRMTVIREGLDAGALVAVDHLQSLAQDQRVRVQRKPEGSSVAERDGRAAAAR